MLERTSIDIRFLLTAIQRGSHKVESIVDQLEKNPRNSLIDPIGKREASTDLRAPVYTS